MSRDITLDARIGINFPGAADIIVRLKDYVFDELL